MENDFERSTFYNYLVNGNLKTAMSYLERFPSQAALYENYVSRFQEESYPAYEVDAALNDILLAYQKYYRDALYLELPAEEAAQRLEERLTETLQAEPGRTLDELEEMAAEAFHRKSFYALMGRTGGYYGPYIWKTEELKHYTVELPEGAQDYAVKFLDGFVMRSWLDYISFGESGTGGWSNGDGLIHCVRSSYDLESESFQVSLLKHEAQHAMDQARYQGITSEELEYRAKLVELIYSRERPMLEQFIRQADGTSADNGHGLAAKCIAKKFGGRLQQDHSQLTGLSVGKVQAVSRDLFAESCEAMAAKYR